MIQVFLTIFIAVLIGIALAGPIGDQAWQAASASTGLANSSSFGPTVLKLVPGMYVIMILGVVVAGLYSVFNRLG